MGSGLKLSSSRRWRLDMLMLHAVANDRRVGFAESREQVLHEECDDEGSASRDCNGAQRMRQVASGESGKHDGCTIERKAQTLESPVETMESLS